MCRRREGDMKYICRVHPEKKDMGAMTKREADA
jgi:hypothetical protein